jgi:dipeptidyl aminopeptidase/acylaminoacyl peptidase
MTNPKVTPYGSWKSPISSDLIVADTVSLGQVEIDGGDVYWVEGRPSEGGRYVVVKRSQDGQVEDVTPQSFNARTRVHEYGGGAFAVKDGIVYFSNYTDQRLYRVGPGSDVRPLTPEVALRFADGQVDEARNLLFCVREDHTIEGREAVNTLTCVRLDGDEGGGRVIASGSDFYSTPRLSPDGTRLAWLTWEHPNMPWDGTTLWVADVAQDGSLSNKQQIAGGPNESIFQPEWSPDGLLYFVSDKTVWWNLYRAVDGQIEPLYPMEAEFGAPQWKFGYNTYAFVAPGKIICTIVERGFARLALLDTSTKTLEPIDTDYTTIDTVHSSRGQVVVTAGAPLHDMEVVRLDLESGNHEILWRSSKTDIDLGYISVPEAIEFPTDEGLTAHAFFYPPSNKDYQAPTGEKPPLLVLSHGGPTGQSSPHLDLEIQYWTSRGIAVLDVNYGGSTGYGTEYRRRLNGMWGVVDMNDCTNGALYLAEQGRVDGDRLMIMGGSAGGYTTLCALTFRDEFKAGASFFGISDLEAMTADTHKFESRYLDSMIGPYPERKDLYVARSPIHHIDRLSSPMIILQGLEDKVVPPNQAEMMVDALREKNLPVAYLPFEGEQHGFRRAENIKRSLDATFYFFARIFGYEPADEIEPVEIENLGD